VVDSEPAVVWNFTWAVLGMEDDNFWHLGGVTRWNTQFLIHEWTFLAIISVASKFFLCLFWISLWLKNRCLQHHCFKNLCIIAQASKNSDSNIQHFLSDLRTHLWFHSMLFALPGYQFPYTVMNRCLYLNAKSFASIFWIDPTILLMSFSNTMVPLPVFMVFSVRRTR
jgi:hypothetical protein